MSAVTLEDWHKRTYGHRPALFLARRASSCCWCSGPIVPGDDACYWPEHDAAPAHAGCLAAVYRASV